MLDQVSGRSEITLITLVATITSKAGPLETWFIGQELDIRELTWK
jgi:hypothetical protein